MKKTLLLAGAAAVALTGMAGVEKTVYPDMDGLSCTNLWNVSRTLDNNEFNASEFAQFNNKTRSTAVMGDVLLVAQSKTMVEGENSNDYATLMHYDLYTGKYLKSVQLSVNGTPISGLLCANQIGVDDAGNLWMVGLTGDSNKTPFKIYHVLDINTGETELAATIEVPEDEKNTTARRHDYYDLVGDVTGKTMNAVFMTPVANDDQCSIIGFAREQGSDQWTPHMDAGEYAVGICMDTYPAGQTTWNGAPMLRIVRDEDNSASTFYVDAFVTPPTLYDNSSAMIDNFGSVAGELVPTNGANGCTEFELGGDTFLVYALRDYDGAPGSQVSVTKFGDDLSFESMKGMWVLPQDGFGTITDTGSRMFGMNPVKRIDSNGNEAIYLALAKCNGGMAAYRIAQPGFDASQFEAGVNDIVADDTTANATVEYFNLLGESVANPAAGQLVIKRQGNTVEKMIVR